MVDGISVAYTFSVVSTDECPINVDTVFISTVLFSARVAKVCLAVWKQKSDMSNGNEKKTKRNLLEISRFSIFCQMSKKQESEDYCRCSVTKPLAGQLPKRTKVTRSGSDNIKRRYITLIVIVLHTKERL